MPAKRFSSLRLRSAAAAALSAGLAVAATGCSSSTSLSASGSPSPAAATPSVSRSAGTATLHLYGVQQSSGLYTADGRPVDNPSAPPALGSYVVGTDTDYDGDHTKHSAAAVGSDHLYCLITKSPSTGICSAEIQLGTGMLLADHSTQDLSGNGAMTFPITGGTSSYAGAHGTVTVNPVGTTGNSDFTISYSR